LAIAYVSRRHLDRGVLDSGHSGGASTPCSRRDYPGPRTEDTRRMMAN
jgi:hypothetical protein